MPGFHAPEKKKNHGKMAARATILARIYPHALEKSHIIFVPGEAESGSAGVQPDEE
jgi:hypothetical protein